jgi:hypothetical protein
VRKPRPRRNRRAPNSASRSTNRSAAPDKPRRGRWLAESRALSRPDVVDRGNRPARSFVRTRCRREIVGRRGLPGALDTFAQTGKLAAYRNLKKTRGSTCPAGLLGRINTLRPTPAHRGYVGRETTGCRPSGAAAVSKTKNAARSGDRTPRVFALGRGIASASRVRARPHAKAR